MSVIHTQHSLEDAHPVLRDLERGNFHALNIVEKQEKHLRKRWQEPIFEQWVAQTEPVERLLAQCSVMRFWYESLWDAVELVDWRSGEIRDRAINAWLFQETLNGLRAIEHPRVQKLVDRLSEQRHELLTFLDLFAPTLARWQQPLSAHFTDAAWAAFFQASVARTWRLEHALRNGHPGGY